MATKTNSRRHLQNWPRLPLQDIDNLLPKKLPQIRLRHGQVLWLLTELGYRGAVSDSAFFEYIKSLRKLGIPFGRKRFQTKDRRKLANYSYCHVMELALTLSLRVYHVVPDKVLRGIIHYRSQLCRFYRRAYAERRSGAGRPTLIRVKGRKRVKSLKPIELRGLFLDLNIEFSGGHLVRFGRPKLLSSTETLARFSGSSLSGRAFMPLSLSLPQSVSLRWRCAHPTLVAVLRSLRLRAQVMKNDQQRDRLHDNYER
jgi:hypothetical protein